MDDAKIRQIVREELQRSQNAGRFGLNSVPFHTHDGTNSPKVKAENILPSTSVVGTVTISQATTYTLNLDARFTPQNIVVNGIFTGSFGGDDIRGITVGSAQLTPTFYFTDNEASGDVNVYEQNLQFPFNGKPAQQSSALWLARDSSAFPYANASRDHIVSVYHGTSTSDSDDDIRVTVTDFGKNSITLEVPILVSGWTLFLNFHIT